MKNNSTLVLTPVHEDTVIGKLLELKTHIDYHNTNIKPFYDNMETWEANEYKGVFNELTKDFQNLKIQIIENKSLFDEILYCCNLTVESFISSYLDV